MSQWLQQAGNGTWLGGINKTLPLPPKAKAVSGSGSLVTDYIGKTPGAFGYATSSEHPYVATQAGVHLKTGGIAHTALNAPYGGPLGWQQ